MVFYSKLSIIFLSFYYLRIRLHNNADFVKPKIFLNRSMFYCCENSASVLCCLRFIINNNSTCHEPAVVNFWSLVKKDLYLVTVFTWKAIVSIKSSSFHMQANGLHEKWHFSFQNHYFSCENHLKINKNSWFIMEIAGFHERPLARNCIPYVLYFL